MSASRCGPAVMTAMSHTVPANFPNAIPTNGPPSHQNRAAQLRTTTIASAQCTTSAPTSGELGLPVPYSRAHSVHQPINQYWQYIQLQQPCWLSHTASTPPVHSASSCAGHDRPLRPQRSQRHAGTCSPMYLHAAHAMHHGFMIPQQHGFMAARLHSPSCFLAAS